jgi:AcrR family transcriptional regulator
LGKQDKRNLQTELQIEMALVDLMHEKSFNEINVTDLSRKAGIGRGTFYIHYLDKVDLLNKLETRLLTEIKEVLYNVIPEELKSFSDSCNKTQPSDLVIKTLDYFYQNASTFAALLGPNGDPYLLGKIKLMFRQLMLDTFNDVKNRVVINVDVPEDYILELVIDYSMNIVVYWISKKNPERPQQIAQIIKETQRIAPNDLIKIKN